MVCTEYAIVINAESREYTEKRRIIIWRWQ